MVQWVGRCAPNVGGPGSIPGWGTRSHMHAATKTQHAATMSLHATTKRSRIPQLRPGTAKINKLKKKILRLIV